MGSSNRQRTKLGKQLLQARLDAGLAQWEAADIVGVAQSHMVRLEFGDCQPTLPTLAQLCIAYGKQPWELLEGITVDDILS